MKSLLDYTDEELTLWVEKVRSEREAIRNGKITASQTVKREKREKVERKAKEKGIEVIGMDDVLKAFLK